MKDRKPKKKTKKVCLTWLIMIWLLLTVPQIKLIIAFGGGTIIFWMSPAEL